MTEDEFSKENLDEFVGRLVTACSRVLMEESHASGVLRDVSAILRPMVEKLYRAFDLDLNDLDTRREAVLALAMVMTARDAIEGTTLPLPERRVPELLVLALSAREAGVV